MINKRQIVILCFALLALVLVLAGSSDSQGPAPVSAAPMPKAGTPSAMTPGLQKVSAADSVDLADLYQSADELMRAGRLSEAVSAYEKALRSRPDEPETYMRLGMVYFKLNLPSKAEEYYQQAVSHGMDNSDIFFQLGYIKEVRGELDLALANYLKAIDKGSRNPELFYNTGNAYARLDKKAEAIASYLRTVSINPDHMNAFVNLSVVSFQLGLYSDARFYLDKAVALGYKPDAEYLKVLDEKTRH